MVRCKSPETRTLTGDNSSCSDKTRFEELLQVGTELTGNCGVGGGDQATTTTACRVFILFWAYQRTLIVSTEY